MNRIRWYGPTVLLVLTVLLVMLLGPDAVRQMRWVQTDAKITQVRESLESNPGLAALSNEFRKVATVVEPSVVHIQVATRSRGPATGRMPLDEDMLRRFFGPRFQIPEEEPGEAPGPAPGEFERFNVPRPYGNGSGWVFDNQGHIVTNNHVVTLPDGQTFADEIIVKFHDGAERRARVVGSDHKTDVAVLKVEGDNLHPATIARDPIEQGDIVFAFGSPFRFEFSMSQGIVSAKGRRLGIVGDGQGYENFIQTDAAINPGNSGGPLTNIYGQVVGMNTAIASRTGTYTGLGFAIPVDMVTEVVEQIVKTGRVIRGYLGIYIDDLDPRMARTFGFTGRGVLVMDPIADGPAAKAGIRPGDIVTRIDDRAVTSTADLRRIVANYAPGATVRLDIFRDGETQVIEATIDELPSQVAAAGPNMGGPVAPEANDAAERLLREIGFESVVNFMPELATQLRLRHTPGVLIRGVRPNSAAYAATLAPRQIITDVQGVPVQTVEELTAELRKHDLTKGVRLSVTDGSVRRFVLLEFRGG